MEKTITLTLTKKQLNDVIQGLKSKAYHLYTKQQEAWKLYEESKDVAHFYKASFFKQEKERINSFISSLEEEDKATK